ncbi:MAG: N-acetyltransferase [Pseudomonadota bacterium]
MTEVTIRRAVADDAERLDTALQALGHGLGDPHNVSPEIILRDAFSDRPVFHALIAEQDARLVGIALVSPMFSTATGGSGGYVSDLWVDGSLRGHGIGRRLLAEACALAIAEWNAVFLRLSVYHATPEARAFYDRLGFTAHETQSTLSVFGPEFDRLRTPQ